AHRREDGARRVRHLGPVRGENGRGRLPAAPGRAQATGAVGSRAEPILHRGSRGRSDARIPDDRPGGTAEGARAHLAASPGQSATSTPADISVRECIRVAGLPVCGSLRAAKITGAAVPPTLRGSSGAGYVALAVNLAVKMECDLGATRSYPIHAAP